MGTNEKGQLTFIKISVFEHLVSRGSRVPFNEPEHNAIIGRKKRSDRTPSSSTQTNPNRPITRSSVKDHNNLVSELGVMDDSIQDQLRRLFQLLAAEQQANQQRQEKVDLLNAKLDAISGELEASRRSHSSTGSHHRRQQETGGSSHDGSGERPVVPKFTKLDFPKYNGLDDPLGWLNRCEHFFKHQATMEEEKVGLASYHLEGIAQLWFMQLLDDVPSPTWAEFSQHCNLRFGPPIRSNKLGELAKLQQNGSVTDYQTHFEALVSRAGSLSQSQKVQLYVSGLQEAIAVEVELHQPPDLATAMSMSRLYERKLFPGHTLLSDTKETPTTGAAHYNRSVKRISREEMDERRKRGLCFNCDEPFVRGHQCKRLFWIEFVDKGALKDATFDPSEDEPHQALSSVGV